MEFPLQFRVPGLPVAQPRQRHRIVKRHKGSPFVQNYTPSDDPVQGYKLDVQIAALSAFGTCKPLDCPFVLMVDFIFPRPKSIPNRYPGRQWKDTRPDGDNLLKAILDALTGVIWRDDAQVVWMAGIKWYGSIEDEPHTLIHVRPA